MTDDGLVWQQVPSCFMAANDGWPEMHYSAQGSGGTYWLSRKGAWWVLLYATAENPQQLLPVASDVTLRGVMQLAEWENNYVKGKQ